MAEYLEIKVQSSQLWAEHISYLLIEKIGCSGTVIEEDGTVKGYLFCTRMPDLSKLNEWKVSTRKVKDEEWAHSWKKYWKPLKAGEKIVICPRWEQYSPNPNEVKINLDPGSAFGTGTHPTTRQCIQAIEQAISKYSGKITMADVGTGSGILAISGVKLGADSVTGVDIDAASIPVAIENAKLNGIEKNCTFYTGTAPDVKGNYDIVVSNILAEIIIDTLPDLKKILKQKGTLILSGIIDQKVGLIETAINKTNLKVLNVIKNEGWATVVAGF